MAHSQLFAPSITGAFIKFPSPPRSHIPLAASGGNHRISKCDNVRSNLTNPCDETIVRRSADYRSPVWKYDYLQSLSSNYVGETNTRHAAKLKEDVRMMLETVEEPLEKLELVDIVQRLGIAYHFEAQIKGILESIYNNNVWRKGDLYATALQFRLLRQHRYNVTQDVFSSFVDELGNFKASLCEDTLGMLHLFEASFHLIEGENILEEARVFTTKHPQENIKDCTDSNLALLVSHALQLPLHWSMLRMEARWFISTYEKRQDTNPTLVEFAKLDFNLVQAIHQEDLKEASRWWEGTGWGKQMSFVRDRLMEAYIWSVGETFEPHFSYYRRMATRVNALVTAIDDVYDVYGTLEELHLFTEAIERWDVHAMEQLPDYMKICFLGLFNTVNELAYDSLKGQGLHILPHLTKAWLDLTKCYTKEATWYYTGDIPTLEEYLEVGWNSITITVMLVHGYFLSTNSITKEALECLDNYHDIIKWSSMVVRLANDLVTSLDEIKRGDNPKSIQVYMHETGCLEEEAREHINYLTREAWKKINEARLRNSPFDDTFMEIATNVARVAHFIYQYGDGHGHGVENREIKDRISLLIVEPIPIK